MKIKVVEKAGTKIKNLIQKSEPFRKTNVMTKTAFHVKVTKITTKTQTAEKIKVSIT